MTEYVLHINTKKY